MAKQQNLPLGPMEISGIFGRLLCCLAYETDYSAEVKKRLPKIDGVVVTPNGSGKVVGINVFKETLSVEPDSELSPCSTVESGLLQRRPH